MKLSWLTVAMVCSFAGWLSAAEPVVLFEDSFDEKPGEGWTWLREETQSWRIQDGGLEIRVQPGKADTVKNALMRDAPDRSSMKYAIEVTIDFKQPPIQQYEQAGITWYQKGKPVMKLVHEHVDGKVLIVPGFKEAPGKTVQFRLVVEGTRWTAQYREDLKGEFQEAATGALPPPGEDQISLQCYDGPSEAEHWMRFDDFRIIRLPD